MDRSHELTLGESNCMEAHN